MNLNDLNSITDDQVKSASDGEFLTWLAAIIRAEITGDQHSDKIEDIVVERLGKIAEGFNQVTFIWDNRDED